MTVCVAAFGNIRGPQVPPVLVTASDRMITIDDIEYEPDQTKAVQLATQTVALLAGEMEVHAAICPLVAEGLRKNPPDGFLIKDIAERYALEFSFHRRYVAQQEILLPLGLTTDTFLTRQNEMSHEFIRDVADRLLDHRLKADAIIAGIDHTGAHIYKIIDPGVAVCFDTPCFAAIGIGQPHAESHLMTTGFNKNLDVSHVLYAVFSAKMKAEIAAGIGKKTDLFVISGGLRELFTPGGANQAHPNEMAALRAIFDKQQEEARRLQEVAIIDVEALLRKAAEDRKDASQKSPGDTSPSHTDAPLNSEEQGLLGKDSPAITSSDPT
jgi:hypothetical protein